jgi:hypothetical protein
MNSRMLEMAVSTKDSGINTLGREMELAYSCGQMVLSMKDCGGRTKQREREE